MSNTALAERDLDKSLISDVALEIGKEMVAYLERMYPDVYAVMNSGCKLSIRNHITTISCGRSNSELSRSTATGLPSGRRTGASL